MSKNRTRNRNRASRPPEPATASLGLVLDRPEAQAENERLIADRETLFTIGENSYTIPKRCPAAWTAMAINLTAEHGEAVTLDWGFQTLLGPDGYRALTTFAGVSDSDWGRLSRIIADKLVPDPKA